MTTESERLYTDANIEPFRKLTDSKADEVLEHLLSNGYSTSLGAAPDFINKSLSGQKISQASRRVFQDFHDFNHEVPHWVDFDAINRGRLVYLRHAPVSTMVIFMAGLIGSYSAAKGVKVLVRTGRLKQDILPRLFETAQMTSDVLQEDSLKVGNIGHQTLLRVRLMHAGVRRLILREGNDWNFDWGHPVNQEDMCGTLTLFSYVVLKGLETLGIYVPEQDKEDYIHLWRYCGHLLGCDDFFLPASYAETEALYAAVRRRQVNPDEDSRALVHLVINAVAREYKERIPKEAFYSLSRFFIGDELANQLELPQSRFWSLVYDGMVPFLGLTSFFMFGNAPANLLFNTIMPPLGDRYIKDTIKQGLSGRRTEFPIPGVRAMPQAV